MERFIPFQPLVKIVGAPNSTNEKIGTLDPPLENNDATSQLEPQKLSAESYQPYIGIKFTQTADPNN